MSEYSTTTNVLFLSANITASEKVSFFVEGVYSTAKGSFDPFDMPLPDDIPEEVNISPDHPGGSSKGAYDFTVISDYSDLNYTQLEGTVGVNYQLDKTAALYGSVNLMDLQDDQVYVYGDLTGSIITYAAGLNIGF